MNRPANENAWLALEKGGYAGLHGKMGMDTEKPVAVILQD
jgi:hypothetical protein